MRLKLTVFEISKQLRLAKRLLGRVESLLDECREIAKNAKENKAWPAAVAALREVRSCVELLARLRGESKQSGTQVNVGVAVNVPQAASSEDDGNLELQIARHMREATMNFDPAEIARLQGILASSEGSFIESTLPPGTSPLQLPENKAPREAVVERM